MPNWVWVQVDMSGPFQDLEAFRTLMFREDELYPGEQEMVFEFDRIIPFPEDATLEEKSAGWGCIWIGSNLHEDEIINLRSGHDAYSLRFRFDTPWRYPHPVFIALNKKFPQITMQVDWEDRNGGIGGEWEYGPDGVNGNDWRQVSVSR